MNKAHRDRIAFMRICSGRFEAGMEVNHVQGGKKIRLTQPQQLMAESRKIIEEAYARRHHRRIRSGYFLHWRYLMRSRRKIPV